MRREVTKGLAAWTRPGAQNPQILSGCGPVREVSTLWIVGVLMVVVVVVVMVGVMVGEGGVGQ